jgi:hypothetical protein
MERLIESAWKTDGMAIGQRFWDNFRPPLMVKLLATTKRAFHVVAIVRKARK